MRNLADLLIHVPLKEQFRRIRVGLQAPKDSAEYKYARESLLCMFGPSTVSMIGSVLVACAALFIEIEGTNKPIDTSYTVEIVEPATTKLDDLKVDEVKPEDVKPPDPQDLDPTLSAGEKSEITTPGPPQEFSSNDDPNGVGNGVGGDMDTPVVPFAVVMTKSPIIMKGLYGNRTKGGREKALRAYGGGGAGGAATEAAVMRALRWLKKYQEADGSWKGESGGLAETVEGEHYGYSGMAGAMTALGVLTFLGHGETPASKEFGSTVERAMKWLLDNQNADGMFPTPQGDLGYTHAICTYALCESYGLMKMPMMKAAAEKAVAIIIKGQHASGGWDYKCNPATERNDTSVMGWCAQALKAGKMAGLENEGLSEALKRAVIGFKKNAAINGEFGYDSNVEKFPGLTGVGVLCLQLLGASREPECRNGVLWLEKNATCEWEKPWGRCPIYYWYYTTQTKFHSGGKIWDSWNKQFAPMLVKNQTILKGAGIDGKDIGYWKPAFKEEYCQNYVYNTTLCTLQLEVYYRYLPTYQPPTVEGGAEKEDSGDIKIEVSMPAASK